MRIFRTIVTVCFWLLPAVAGFSQIAISQQCATMEQDSINRARFPQRGNLAEFEIQLQQKVREFEALKKSGKTKAEVLTIPMIVHVVHNGESVGTGANISQAQVQAQLAVLNEDFRRLQGTPGHNDNPLGADIEIEFCLSPVDENGITMSEPGIHRYLGGKASWSRTEIENQLKPASIWNPNLFFNVWTLRFAAIDANLLGYAQFPDQSGLTGLPASGPASTDGVVIRYQSFGSADKGTFPVMEAPYNKGRTLSHETGHWLGLRHIWGDGNCADDFVADTPSASGPSSGCPTGRISCGNTNMVENYMDYSNDACMNIFTQGQKLRMQVVMSISPRRKTLVLANLCSPIVADVPTANFTVDNQLVLKGAEASFTDLSTNFPKEWKWTFDGGEPASSTERNPTVRYVTPGAYKVSLVATNSKGSSKPLEIANYITVSEDGLCGKFNNFLNDYTASDLSISNFGPYTGHLTGNNSAGTKAISEYFRNLSGYRYISGVKIKFAELIAEDEEATVNVVVWNARGAQNAPGSVIERKVVLAKQIKADIANNRPTEIIFDRETPVFGRPFQVGIELTNASASGIAIESSADGEAVNATSWIQNSGGAWSSYALAFGANIAMNIAPQVGMNLSVQVSSSKLLIYPGEEVVLNGRGASIFVWKSADGKVQNVVGPQLKVNPTQTTTLLTIGSGLDLCLDSAYTTIYVRENITAISESNTPNVQLYPNPGDRQLFLQVSGAYRGAVSVTVLSPLSQTIASTEFIKQNPVEEFSLSPELWAKGMYLIRVQMGQASSLFKWVKH